MIAVLLYCRSDGTFLSNSEPSSLGTSNHRHCESRPNFFRNNVNMTGSKFVIGSLSDGG